jgi:hypothetical protein
MGSLVGSRFEDSENLVSGRVPVPGPPRKSEEVKPGPGSANLPPNNVRIVQPEHEEPQDRFVWFSENQRLEHRIRQLEATVSILEENVSLLMEDVEELQSVPEESGESTQETEESQKAPSSLFNQETPETESSSSA